MLSIVSVLLLNACDDDAFYGEAQLRLAEQDSCLADERHVDDGVDGSCVPVPFTLAVIGDTQELVDQNDPHAGVFPAMTQWIVDNAAAENIRFVTHVGDIVQHGADPVEWDLATQALYLLDAVPGLGWAATLGNHDYDDLGAGTGSSYLANVGPDHFSDRAWFGGSDLGFVADDQSVGSGHNSFQLIDVSGRRFLHLNLEYRGGIQWAQTIIDRYPGVPTMITTHELLNDQRSNSGHPRASATTARVVAAAEPLWDQLIRVNSQIFMTFNGHFCCERQLVQVNDAGEEVLHVQANYSVSFQGQIDEDDSWLRLVTFDIAAGEVRLSSFAPSTNLDGADRSEPFPAGPDDLDSEYTWPIDFERRFGKMRRFQDGYHDYAGTQDTWFSRRSYESENQGRPESAYIRTGRWMSEGVEVNQQGLLQFSDIIGAGEGQVPNDSRITAATLNVIPATDILYSTGEANAVYPMLVPWTESGAFYGAGAWAGGATLSIDTDDVEAGSAAASDSLQYADELGTIPSGTQIGFDIIPIVQAWVGGASNYGLLLESLGLAEGDGLFMASSDYQGINPAAAPVLRVAGTPVLNYRSFRQGQTTDGHVYTSASDTWISPGMGDRSSDTQLQVIDYAGPSQQVLVRFDDLIGPADWQIPEDARVSFAALVLTADGSTWAGTPATHGAHRMLVDWTDSDTWDGAWAGVGVSIPAHQAAETADAESSRFLADRSPGTFDVTQSVRAWLASVPNYGWLIAQAPMDDNRWYTASSESTLESLRPTLYVQFE